MVVRDYYSETMLYLPAFNSIPLGYLQLATLTGHTYRVLYLAISPDGQVSLGDLFLSCV
jgi:hypothetical protein